MTHNAPSTLTNVSTREGDDVNSLEGGKRARRASFLQRTTTSPLSRVRVTRVFTKCSSLRSSCSLSLLARNHFPMDSRRRRTKKKKSELIKKSTYPRHPINQTTFVREGGEKDRRRKSGENNDHCWLPPINAITQKCIRVRWTQLGEMPETGAKCVLARNKEFSRVGGGIGEERRESQRGNEDGGWEAVGADLGYLHIMQPTQLRFRGCTCNCRHMHAYH